MIGVYPYFLHGTGEVFVVLLGSLLKMITMMITQMPLQTLCILTVLIFTSWVVDKLESKSLSSDKDK